MEIPSPPPLSAQPYLEQYFPWHVLTRRQSCSAAAVQPLQPASLPSGSPWLLEKRELYSGAPGFMWGNQKQQVMETAGPVGWLWPGASGKVVSGPSGSHCHFLFLYPFTLFLPSLFPQPAFIYCPCLPARITSSNRKQMSSSESEVAVLCPSHHQGNTSDIHFHILGG